MIRFQSNNPNAVDKTAIALQELAAIALQELAANFDRISRSKAAINAAIKMCDEADLNVGFDCFGGIYCAVLNTEEKKNIFIGLCGLHQITVEHMPIDRDANDYYAIFK